MHPMPQALYNYHTLPTSATALPPGLIILSMFSSGFLDHFAALFYIPALAVLLAILMNVFRLVVTLSVTLQFQ
jgi:hypothetical protein